MVLDRIFGSEFGDTPDMARSNGLPSPAFLKRFQRLKRFPFGVSKPDVRREDFRANLGIGIFNSFSG